MIAAKQSQRVKELRREKALGFCLSFDPLEDKRGFMCAAMSQSETPSLDLLGFLGIPSGPLSSRSVWPLYLDLKALPEEKTASYLVELSEEQRRSFLDIDLWVKDDLDVETFSYWIKAYSLCPCDDVRREFVLSSEFALYLKGRFNIMTFDLEEPLYPQHDHFFITDDDLILMEFDEDYTLGEEVKRLIGDLYDMMGVEKAYAYLFKIVSDSFLTLQEQEYQEKNGRLGDLGFMDYYEALDVLSPLPSKGCADRLIVKGVGGAHAVGMGTIEEEGGLQQIPPHPAMAPYRDRDKIEEIMEDFARVASDERRQFLRFDFLRMVHGTLSMKNALKGGALSMGHIGRQTRGLMSLGLQYGKKIGGAEGEQCLLERLTFTDFYRVGRTLVTHVQKKIKTAFKRGRSASLHKEHPFLGNEIIQYMEDSFEDVPCYQGLRVEDLAVYEKWEESAQTLVDLLPYVQSFYETFDELVAGHKVHDGFYINYKIENIDFEAILISSFANFILGVHGSETQKKLGLMVSEFLNFFDMFYDAQGNLLSRKALDEGIEKFSRCYGLDKVFKFKEYFTGVLNFQLEGTFLKGLKKEDFQYVGGPIIFKTE